MAKSDIGQKVTSDKKLPVTKSYQQQKSHKWPKVINTKEKRDKKWNVTIYDKIQKVTKWKKWQLTNCGRWLKVTSDKKWQGRKMSTDKKWQVTKND